MLDGAHVGAAGARLRASARGIGRKPILIKLALSGRRADRPRPTLHLPGSATFGSEAKYDARVGSILGR